MQSMHAINSLTRQDLELAVAIAEEGSVTRAALRLNLSQPAVSHHLRSLEERIGSLLFQRKKQGMAATSIGEELAERGRRICREFRTSEEALSRMLLGKKQVVRLGSECYTSYQWLPFVVRQLAQMNQNVELRIVIEATHRAKEALVAGAIDAAILQSSGEDHRFVYWPLFKDELVLVVSARHALARSKVAEARDLSEDTLILHHMP